MRRIACRWILLLPVFLAIRADGQSYIPIPVMGFNHDVFTEAYPNTLNYTDTVLDATLHIMYTASFAALSGLPGGLPNSGFIADAPAVHQYQLSSYGAGNALTVMRNNSRSLILATPGTYSKISLLGFSTEGPSIINVKLKFSDGTIAAYLTNYNLADWFYGTSNIVVSGFGRCQRKPAASYGPDGYPSNPRFYYIDISLNCNDRNRVLEEVILSNVTATGSNAPFPNAVFLALSGIPFQQSTSYTTSPATCSASNGSATLDLAGTASPFSVSWNTNPVQSGFTASNLASGTYTATISDAQGCSFFIPVTVPQQNSTVNISTLANPASICSGSVVQLSVTATGGGLSSINWNPGNLTGAQVNVSPAVTTLYTVSGLDQYGCAYSGQVNVTVNSLPAPPVINPVSVCRDSSARLEVVNPQQGEQYNWFTPAGLAAGSGSSFQTAVLNSGTMYYVETVSSAGCISPTRTPVNISLITPLSTPIVRVSNLSTSAVQFSWSPIPGATGYEIVVNRGNGVQASALPVMDTSFTVLNVIQGQSISLQVRAMGVQNCENSAVSVAVTALIPGNDLFVPDAFTPNGDGKNDYLRILGNAMQNLDFRVFNNWGQEVFRSKNAATAWDGSLQGRPQPTGVYVYLLKATLPGRSVIIKKGTILLLR